MLEDELKFNQAMGRTLEVNNISLADAQSTESLKQVSGERDGAECLKSPEGCGESSAKSPLGLLGVFHLRKFCGGRRVTT
jgi:hypothetical protein